MKRVSVGGALGALCRVLRRERVELRLQPRRELLRLLELRREHGALRRHLRVHRRGRDLCLGLALTHGCELSGELLHKLLGLLGALVGELELAELRGRLHLGRHGLRLLLDRTPLVCC